MSSPTTSCFERLKVRTSASPRCPALPVTKTVMVVFSPLGYADEIPFTTSGCAQLQQSACTHTLALQESRAQWSRPPSRQSRDRHTPIPAQDCCRSRRGRPPHQSQTRVEHLSSASC